MEADYASGRLYPNDLKPAVSEALNMILEPVREHFSKGEPKIMLDKIKKFKITK
jgi:tyrosyl-tRNA synthetase